MQPYFLLLATTLLSFSLRAQLPQKFNYQAVVRNNAGTIVANQAVALRFSIRDVSANGTVQYQETQSATTNAFGLVNLQVGAGTIVTGSFANITWGAGAKFLQIEADITGGTTYASLATVELVSVPYAVQADRSRSFSGTLAGDVSGSQGATVIGANAVTNGKIVDNAISANKISDNAISANKIADNAITTGKIADSTISSRKIAAGNLVRSINGLKDDIQLSPGAGTSFDVTGNTITINGSGGDITGVIAGAGLTGGGGTGNVTLATAYGGNGVQNTASRSDHNHVGQTWTATSGGVLTTYSNDANAIGLNTYSYATGYSGASLAGQVLSTTGQSIGVFGSTSSNDQYAAGVFGQATRSGASKAIWGYGLGANTFAIYGEGAGTGSYAGYFQGRVHVNGLLSKSAGSFKIDHPLDPANKFLSHSFVESPDMMNIYNGNIVLDARGEATVTLPDYFQALNIEFRYQLTAIGKPSPGLYVADEISGNRFRIAGGTPGGKVSWMVTGVRNDPYARANRIQVEEDKPANERGTLLFNGTNTRSQPAPERNMNPPQPQKN